MRDSLGRMPRAPTLKILALAVLMFLHTRPTAGQSPTPALVGSVTDTLGHPLGYSLITLLGQHGRQYQIAAHADGRYVFDSAPVFAFVPEGPYTLRVNYVGFAKAERDSVPLLRGKTVVVNFRLSPWNQPCDLACDDSNPPARHPR